MSISTITAAAVSTTSYYVIGKTRIGGTRLDHPDYDHIVVSTEPAATPDDRKFVFDGWVGNADDVSATAYGAFTSLEAARERALELVGDDFRELTSEHDGYVAVFKSGGGVRMGAAESVDACHGTIKQITGSLTDADLDEWVKTEARQSREWAGTLLDEAAVRKAMVERRDYLNTYHYKVICYLIGTGPNPDKHRSVDSFHVTLAEAEAERDRLEWAEYEDSCNYEESAQPAYSYSYEVEEI